MTVPRAPVTGAATSASRLLLGTMIVNAQEQERSSTLLDAAHANGINALDTAHGYAGGESERGIGAWMAARGNRQSVFILTKGAHPGGGVKRVTRKDIAADLHDSLVRLQTDYVDLYLLHRDDPAVPAGEIVEWLNEHHAAGRIQAFGGSNWRHERIQQANDYAAQHGLVPFAASSPHFSLAEQVDSPWGEGCVTLTGAGEQSARSWYAANRMPVFAYSSLARGLFSGRITRANYQGAADGACRKAYCHEVNFRRLDRASALAADRNLSVAQVALAYLLNHPLNLFPLIGAANEAEIQACVAAVAVKLTSAEMAWLDLQREDRC